MKEFSATQLQQYLQTTNDDPLLLDVREQWEFDRCKIDGSVLVPMGQIPGQLNELDPDRVTVVICHHGIRSRSVGNYLERAGFENIINLSGGVDAWAREVDLDMAVY